MEWQLLSKTDGGEFIGSVKNDRFPGLFDTDRLDVQSAPLSFYPGGALYVIQNYTALPSFDLHYLKKDEHIAFLDGSADAFEEFNAKSFLDLNENNVIDYLDVYCSLVIQRPNNVLLLRNADKMPFIGDYYIDFHFDKNNFSEKDIALERNSENNGYIVGAPFVFDGKIDPATACISDSGGVRVERREGA